MISARRACPMIWYVAMVWVLPEVGRAEGSERPVVDVDDGEPHLAVGLPVLLDHGPQVVGERVGGLVAPVGEVAVPVAGNPDRHLGHEGRPSGGDADLRTGQTWVVLRHGAQL